MILAVALISINGQRRTLAIRTETGVLCIERAGEGEIQRHWNSNSVAVVLWLYALRDLVWQDVVWNPAPAFSFYPYDNKFSNIFVIHFSIQHGPCQPD